MQPSERSGIDATSEPYDDRNKPEATTGGPSMERHRYELTIETAAGVGQDESVRMLRSFLKCAIRSYRIKCLSVERIKHGSQEGVEDEPQSPRMRVSDK